MASVNSMDFMQLSTILNDVYQQATGQKGIAITDESEFISVAQKTLQMGYDPIINSLSQVLSRTIFSVRPYSAKFKGLEVDSQKYGSITRKVTAIDKPFDDDDRLKLVDGQSIDQYKVNKPEVIQLNYYGADVYHKSITIFKDQLDSAMSSSAMFGDFISMVVTNINDQIEQAKEATSRMTVNNLVAGIIAGQNANQVVHLLTEYNNATGSSLTKQTALAPANINAFAKWCYAFLSKKVDMLSERTSLYHTNLTGKTILRHTPASDLNVFALSDFLHMFNAEVLADTYHESFLSVSNVESVNYWQAANAPDEIKIIPTYLKADGTLDKGAAVEQDNIVAVMMDKEAAGITTVNQWTANTPFNAGGGYTNTHWHFTEKYWNDFTENALVILLD